jgi:hypothetical protein
MIAGASRKVEPPHPHELPYLMEREFFLRAQLTGRACDIAAAAAAAFGHEFRGLLEHRVGDFHSGTYAVDRRTQGRLLAAVFELFLLLTTFMPMHVNAHTKRSLDPAMEHQNKA